MEARRLCWTASLLLLVKLLTPSPGSAATMFGVRAGEYTDAGDPFAGIEVNTQLRDNVWFNPNLEYVFRDGGDLATLNFDLHYDFDVPHPLLVWAGAGPALVYSRRELPRGRSDSETDLGLNLLGGVGWSLGSVVPYLQAKAIVSDEDEFVVAFGLRF